MTPPTLLAAHRAAAAGSRLLRAVMLGLLLALAVGPVPASAHAQLLKTSPEDGAVIEDQPEIVELEFNEPVSLIDGAIRLFPAAGEAVPLQARTSDHSVIVTLPEGLVPGTYVLSYRIISADGHPVGGASTFHLGEPSASQPTEPALPETGTPASTERAVTALTALQYLGVLTVAGLTLFRLVVLRSPARPRRGPLRVLLAAYAISAVAACALVPVSALRVMGLSLSSLFDAPSWSSAVNGDAVAVAALIVLVGGGGLLLTRWGAGLTAAVVAAAMACGAASAPVLTGHTRTVGPPWLVITADIAHLLAGAVWTGGLIALLMALMPTSRGAGDAPRNPVHAASITVRFSHLALISVLALVLSGAILAVRVLEHPAELLSTGYGRSLLLKLVMVAAVIALAAWNRRRLVPAVLARPTAESAWRSLRQIVRYEAALLIAVIAVTGHLSNSSPTPHSAADGEAASGATVAETATTEFSVSSQGLEVFGIVDPAAVGENTLTLEMGYEGEPLRTEDVEISARLPKEGLGPFTAVPIRDAAGHYNATLSLPRAGQWELQVSARVSQYEQPIAITEITIP